MKKPRGSNEIDGKTADQHTGQGDGPAWEEVAAGRYMPRRIKGSCKGRALG
jgi:hypothetical protein